MSCIKHCNDFSFHVYDVGKFIYSTSLVYQTQIQKNSGQHNNCIIVMIFPIFLPSSARILGQCFNMLYGKFLPHTSQFIIHEHHNTYCLQRQVQMPSVSIRLPVRHVATGTVPWDREVDHSYSSTVEVYNTWVVTSTTPIHIYDVVQKHKWNFAFCLCINITCHMI